jgi:hypothetical protein
MPRSDRQTRGRIEFALIAAATLGPVLFWMFG